MSVINLLGTGAAMLQEPFFWALGVPAVILMGLSKGGFVGVGPLAVPLMAQAMSPVQAAAVLLPLLIVQDAVGAWVFRKSWDRHVMMVMLPSAAVGVLAGYLFAAHLSEAWILIAAGLISILFGVHRVWAEHGGQGAPSHRMADWVGIACGAAAGVASQIAHVGGPPYQLWVMPQRLSRDMFIGTTAVFFAALNWIKAPAYAALGQFTPANLIASAALLPVAIVSTFAGVWMIRRIDPDRFYTLVYWLTAALGLKLLWDGVGILTA